MKKKRKVSYSTVKRYQEKARDIVESIPNKENLTKILADELPESAFSTKDIRKVDYFYAEEFYIVEDTKECIGFINDGDDPNKSEKIMIGQAYGYNVWLSWGEEAGCHEISIPSLDEKKDKLIQDTVRYILECEGVVNAEYQNQ